MVAGISLAAAVAQAVPNIKPVFRLLGAQRTQSQLDLAAMVATMSEVQMEAIRV